MRELLKIMGYVALVMVGGALLAPPLWWLGQWAIAVDFLPSLRPFPFDKYFNRAALLLAIGLLPWLVRSLRIGSWQALGLVPNAHRVRDYFFGLAVALGGFSGTVALLWYNGAVLLRLNTNAWAWFFGVVAACVVGVLEEVLFRGVFFGVLRRTMHRYTALVSLSLVFACLHFLRPNPALPKFATVTAWSGLELLPHLLWEYSQPARLWASGATLFVMALVLGYTVLKTHSLYLAIGLHTGWVFAVKALSLTGVAQSRQAFWLGSDWRSGAAPLGLMLVTAVVMRARLSARQDGNAQVPAPHLRRSFESAS